ncbi:MAG: Coagulation factor 5/8 type domain-containing protein [Vicinamibacterales bacterium]
MRDEQRRRSGVIPRSARNLMLRTSVAASAIAVCSLLAQAASGAALNQAAAPATDIYHYANECVALRDAWSNRHVVRDAFGYGLTSDDAAATPFRMQATALGSYLLYGPDARMPAIRNTGAIGPTATANASADWIVTNDGPALRLTSVATGHTLSVGLLGRLVLTSRRDSRWRFEPAAGCATFPDVGVDVDGIAPAIGPGRTGEARGFVDTHVHPTAFEFLGGRFHCGRPWSRYGVADALQDCPDHGFDGRFALAENLLSTGNLFGTHSNQGWPAFDGWPRHDSLTHEGTYWRGIERAWRGGLRIMVADLVENRALCEIYWLKKNPCGDMESVRLQAKDLYALQDYIDAQFKGPGRGFFRIVKSPREARAVIADGKLAVVMGVETSQPFDCLYRDGVELCTEQQIDDGLQEWWDLGVRSLFPVHKFDNAFGGAMMDGGVTGLLVNFGNFYATGRWWAVGACAGPDADNNPYSFILPGTVCNVRGLTSLGEYLINRMADKGLIVETDHFGVRARARALDILESRGYAGVITSHGWTDATSRQRIQALGGFVGPYASTTVDFVAEWQKVRATRSGATLSAIGFGTDTNGLGAQPAARIGGSTDNPVTYPFASADGTATVDQNQWGGRLWNYNVDGVAHYGLFVDWIEDLKHVAGQDIVDDLSRGAEAYLQMWERASAGGGGQPHAAVSSSASRR